MKIIRTISAIHLEAFDGKPATWSAVETERDLINPFNTNKRKILETSTLIENTLERIITHYFFDRKDASLREKSEVFRSIILSSDWCSFSSKRKIITHIIDELNLLTGTEKNTYDKLLRDTMSFRNSFVHGEMITNGEIVKLKYYEGTPRLVVVTDVFLEKIESTLNQSHEQTLKLSFLTGAAEIYEGKK